MKKAIIILLSAAILITISACAKTSSENAAMPELGSIGGDAMLASFYLPTDNSYGGRSSLNDIGYDLFVDGDEFMAWIREEGNEYYSTPQTSLAEYPNLYSFIVKFGIPVEELREAFEGQLRLSEQVEIQCYTAEEIDIICSLDETRLLAHFASEYAIVIGDRAYPPAWLYLHTPEDYANAGITPEMVKEKLALYSDFNLTDEAKAAFEEKLSEFIGEPAALGTSRHDN